MKQYAQIVDLDNLEKRIALMTPLTKTQDLEKTLRKAANINDVRRVEDQFEKFSE
jgi:hypothetical protein